MSRQSELAELSRVYDSSALSNRNLLINGSQIVSQRGTSKTLVNGQMNFCTDRWHLYAGGFDNFAGTLTQDSDSPDGFANSLKITTTTAESAIASDEYAHLSQLVEAQNLQQLAYGTSAAKQLTLSFYVKSSITGTFACGIYKPDNTAQIHNLTYTIDAANTWERKTLTFAANTLSGGAIDNNNGIGFYVNWHLAAGSSYKGGGSTSGWSAYAQNKWADGLGTDAVMTTTNATFFLTGCQLELGDSATPFEHPRSYGDELARCQRYTYVIGGSSVTSLGAGSMYTTTAINAAVPLPVQLRASPSLTGVANGTGNWLSVYVGATGTNSNATPSGGDSTQAYLRIYATSAHSGSSPAAAGAGIWCMVLADAQLIISAEL